MGQPQEPANRARSGLERAHELASGLAERVRASVPDREPSPLKDSRAGRRIRRRAIALGVVAAAITALVLLGIDGVLSVRRMNAAVTAGRADLVAGTESIETGDAKGASEQFGFAAKQAERATRSASRPAMAIAARLPILGDNVAAVEAVARAQGEAAAAGLTMAEAVQALGWTNLRAPGVTSLGTLAMSQIQAGLGPLDRVADQLADARAELNGIGGHLIGPVATGVDDAVELLDRRLAVVQALTDLGRGLPSLYGDAAARHYLLVVPSLGRPALGIGRIELAGTLDASGGALRVTDVGPAPRALEQLESTPDLRADGRAMLGAAADAGLGPYDGVWILDAQALSDLLWAVGDVDSASWPEPLSFENVVSVLEAETLEGTNAAEATATRAAIVRDVLTAALERRPGLEPLALGLARAVSGRDLAIVVPKAPDRGLLHRRGADGTFVAGRNPLAVWWDTASDNHVAALVRTQVNLLVTLQADGSAKCRTVVIARNSARTGRPSLLLGRPVGEDPDPVGSWRTTGRVLLPAGAEEAAVETSSPGAAGIVEGGRSDIAEASFRLDPGETISTIVTYSLPTATIDTGDGREFRPAPFNAAREPRPGGDPDPVPPGRGGDGRGRRARRPGRARPLHGHPRPDDGPLGPLLNPAPYPTAVDVGITTTGSRSAWSISSCCRMCSTSAGRRCARYHSHVFSIPCRNEVAGSQPSSSFARRLSATRFSRPVGMSSWSSIFGSWPDSSQAIRTASMTTRMRSVAPG